MFVVGGVGFLCDYVKYVFIGFKFEGDVIFFLGFIMGYLGVLLFVCEILGCEDGLLLFVDLLVECGIGDFVWELIELGVVQLVYDVFDGGVFVVVVEMVFVGNIGVDLILFEGDLVWFFFGED